MPERPTLTLTEAAWALGISESNCFRKARAGQLPGAFKFGRRWIVAREPFERWLTSAGNIDVI